eukprot:g1584.t1
MNSMHYHLNAVAAGDFLHRWGHLLGIHFSVDSFEVLLAWLFSKDPKSHPEDIRGREILDCLLTDTVINVFFKSMGHNMKHICEKNQRGSMVTALSIEHRLRLAILRFQSEMLDEDISIIIPLIDEILQEHHLNYPNGSGSRPALLTYLNPTLSEQERRQFLLCLCNWQMDSKSFREQAFLCSLSLAKNNSYKKLAPVQPALGHTTQQTIGNRPTTKKGRKKNATTTSATKLGNKASSSSLLGTQQHKLASLVRCHPSLGRFGKNEYYLLRDGQYGPESIMDPTIDLTSSVSSEEHPLFFSSGIRILSYPKLHSKHKLALLDPTNPKSRELILERETGTMAIHCRSIDSIPQFLETLDVALHKNVVSQEVQEEESKEINNELETNKEIETADGGQQRDSTTVSSGGDNNGMMSSKMESLPSKKKIKAKKNKSSGSMLLTWLGRNPVRSKEKEERTHDRSTTISEEITKLDDNEKRKFMISSSKPYTTMTLSQQEQRRALKARVRKLRLDLLVSQSKWLEECQKQEERKRKAEKIRKKLQDAAGAAAMSWDRHRYQQRKENTNGGDHQSSSTLASGRSRRVRKRVDYSYSTYDAEMRVACGDRIRSTRRKTSYCADDEEWRASASGQSSSSSFGFSTSSSKSLVKVWTEEDKILLAKAEQAAAEKKKLAQRNARAARYAARSA